MPICKKCDHYLVCKYANNKREECPQYKPYTKAKEIDFDYEAEDGR